MYVSGFEKRAHFAQNANFWHFFKLSSHKNYKNKTLRLLTWLISKSGLLLNKPNVRECGGEASVQSTECLKCGIKRQISNAIELRGNTPTPDVSGAQIYSEC